MVRIRSSVSGSSTKIWPYLSSSVPVYNQSEIPGNDTRSLPVPLVTDHGWTLLVPLDEGGHHFFFSWGPQVCSLCSESTLLSESDAFSPFAQNECEVVSQTRSSTSHRVQVGLWAPLWGVGPEDNWTERSPGERLMSPLNKGGTSLLKGDHVSTSNLRERYNF